MPTRYKFSTFPRTYLDKTTEIIHEHVQSQFSYDVTNGGKLDINEMTLGELKSIFEKRNEKITEMYESGELETFLKEWNATSQQFNADQATMMDTLDQVEASISNAESEIYDSLAESDARIASHNQDDVQAALSFGSDDVSLGNLQIADSMGETSGDHAIQARALRNLLGARIVVLKAKAELLKLGQEFEEDADGAIENQVLGNSRQAIYYQKEFGEDLSTISGDAKIYKDQVDSLMATEMKAHSDLAAKRKEVDGKYAECFD